MPHQKQQPSSSLQVFVYLFFFFFFKAKWLFPLPKSSFRGFLFPGSWRSALWNGTTRTFGPGSSASAAPKWCDRCLRGWAETPVTPRPTLKVSLTHSKGVITVQLSKCIIVIHLRFYSSVWSFEFYWLQFKPKERSDIKCLHLIIKPSHYCSTEVSGHVTLNAGILTFSLVNLAILTLNVPCWVFCFVFFWFKLEVTPVFEGTVSTSV